MFQVFTDLLKSAKLDSFVTSMPARIALMPVLFLLSGPKISFSPRRGDTCITTVVDRKKQYGL